MDITKAFTYMFDDKNWMMKLGIGAAISFFSFLIVPIFLLGGYSLNIMRNVRKGVEQPLPEWDDWGSLLSDGFMVALGQFIYTLPILIMMCIAFAATGGLSAFEGLSDEALAAAIFSTFGVVFCIFLLYAIAMIFISPAIRIQYIKNNELSAMFQFRAIIDLIKANMMDILLIVGVMLGVSFAFGIVTTILGVIPCLGQLAAFALSLAFGPYMGMVSGHMMGQLARKITKGDISAAE